MAIVVNIYYSGINGNAKRFVDEMIKSGTVEQIRAEEGNIRYDYFLPIDNAETVLLIDSWKNQESIDKHHNSPMMEQIIRLRDKYDLHMKVERYISDDAEMSEKDKNFIRN
jgi:quinol monooxygenase YgiN